MMDSLSLSRTDEQMRILGMGAPHPRLGGSVVWIGTSRLRTRQTLLGAPVSMTEPT